MSDQQPADPRAQRGAGEPDGPDTTAAGSNAPGWIAPGSDAPGSTVPEPPGTSDAVPPPTAEGGAATWTAPIVGPSPHVAGPSGPPAETFRYPDPAGYGSPSVAVNPWAARGAVPTVAVDPRRRHRRRAVVTGIAASILSLALIGGGVALADLNGERDATTSQSRQLPEGIPGVRPGNEGGQGFVDPDGQSDGSGAQQPGTGNGTGSSSGTSQAAASAATTAQQVGVVTIVSTLGYEHGESAGTGMILTANGTVLTNNHVIEGATSIKVTVESTGATYAATVVGTDATADVAVLKLEGASKLTPVTLETNGAVATGDTVTAVGNAEGTGTLVAATGDVTGTNQTMTASESGTSSETLSSLIEFAANVVSGDSGGPVLDSRGQVVGITTAASSGNAQTVAYAIDINNAMTVVKQIEAGDASGGIVLGYPAFLGVEVAPAGLAASGATIAGVVTGTPAASAGLVAGDTITAVDGTAITSASDLTAAMAQHAPGAKVTITWTSGATGASQSATVTLVKGPAA